MIYLYRLRTDIPEEEKVDKWGGIQTEEDGTFGKVIGVLCIIRWTWLKLFIAKYSYMMIWLKQEEEWMATSNPDGVLWRYHSIIR